MKGKSPDADGSGGSSGASRGSRERDDVALSRRDVLIAGASASVLGVGASGSAAAKDVVVSECASMGEFYAFDEFAIVNNQWNASDCYQRVHLYDDGSYGWEWDRAGEGSGPNYPEVSYGCRPWGSPTTSTSAFPVQRGSVSQMEVELDVDVTVTEGDEWNLALEWWLTRDQPGDGVDVSDTITHEIMVVFEWGSGHSHGTPIEYDAFTDAHGNTYDYWEHYTGHGSNDWSFHIFRISANSCPSNVDLTAVQDYLDAIGDDYNALTDDLWVNGLETGDEYWEYTTGNTTVYTYNPTVDGTTAYSGTNASFADSGYDVEDDCASGGSGDGVVLAVNAGGNAYDASDGTSYEADGYYSNGSTNSTGDAIANTDDDALYQTERWGDPVTYELPVADGSYDVELHFAEIYWDSAGKRVFDVSVEGSTVLSDLDVHDRVGHDTALVETVTGVDVSDGYLTVDMHASTDNAKLAAVRVLESSDSTDTTAPAEPSNLSVTDTTTSEVSLDWDSVSDASYYNVYVDGAKDHDTTNTATTVSSLSSDTSYEFGVTAVDDAGNESTTATVTASTDAESTSDTSSGGLLLNDYDGDPAWPGTNDLGEWCGAGSFENGGGEGEVVDGALRLDYDGGGWIQTYVAQDVSDYTALKLRVRGDAGGEESEFSVELADTGDVLANLTSDTIGTSFSTVSVNLADNGLPTDLGDVYLDFWAGDYGGGAIEIDEIWFE